MNRSCIFAVTLLLSLSLSPCRAGDSDFLVFSVRGDVKADGRALLAGMQIDAQVQLVVPSAGEVTLFGKVGKVTVEAGFQGPLPRIQQDTRAISATSGVTPSIWQLLLSVIAFGSERGPPPAPSHDGWAFTLDAPGNKCVLKGKNPSIAIEPALEGRSASILNVASGEEVSLTLNIPTTEWPSSLLVDPTAEYQTIISGLDKVIKFHLVEIDGGTTLTDATLHQLAAHKCVDQLLQFAAAAEAAAILKN
jgi:hypothetical protein